MSSFNVKEATLIEASSFMSKLASPAVPHRLADSAARKSAGSYVSSGGPVAGMTRVIEDANPDVLWYLIGEDVTQDSNWLATPLGAPQDSITNPGLSLEGDFLNVKDFGAVGDGVADDQPAIQAALEAAAGPGENEGKPIYFPPGTYFLVSSFNDSYHLRFLRTYGGWAKSLKMYGFGQATLRTTKNKQILQILGGHTNSVIKGLNFIREKDDGSGGSNGIVVAGTAGENAVGLKILDNTFDGFGADIVLQGCINTLISNNRFYSYNGRDSATNPAGVGPCVSIWAMSTPTMGMVKNSIVTNNIFDGYSGRNGLEVDAPISRQTKDGSIYSKWIGLVFSNNIVRNFSFEGIGVGGPYEGYAEYPLVISNNTFDANLPDNAIIFGEPQFISWAIRVDAHHVIITGNIIKGACNGIFSQMTTPQNEVPHPGESWNVSNNLIIMSDRAEPRSGITLSGQGFDDDEGYDPRRYSGIGGYVSGNTVIWPYASEHTVKSEYYAFRIVYWDEVFFKNNTANFTNFSPSAASNTYGFRIDATGNSHIEGNTVIGCDYFLGANPNAEGKIRVDNNYYETLGGFSPNNSFGDNWRIHNTVKKTHTLTIEDGVASNNGAEGLNAELTLSEDCILENPRHVIPGSSGSILITQDSAIARNLYPYDLNSVTGEDSVSAMSFLPLGESGLLKWYTPDGQRFFYDNVLPKGTLSGPPPFDVDLTLNNYLSSLETSGVTVSSNQRLAIEEFLQLGADEDWGGSLSRLYLPVWMNESANSRCLISGSSGTFQGNVIHGPGFVSNTDGAFIPGGNYSDLGATKDSFMAGAYVRNQGDVNYGMVLGSGRDRTTGFRRESVDNQCRHFYGQVSSLSFVELRGAINLRSDGSAADFTRYFSDWEKINSSVVGEEDLPSTPVACMARNFVDEGGTLNIKDYNDGEFSAFWFGSYISTAKDRLFLKALKDLVIRLDPLSGS